MKKTLLLIIFLLTFSMTIFAAALPEETITGRNKIGNVYETLTSEGSYLTDAENNIIAGPFEFVSEYGGYPYAFHFDGRKTLFDKDGSVLAAVEKGGEAYYPVNGIYGVSPFDDNSENIVVFEIYDHETKTKLFTAERFFMYYLEQQTEKMFVEKDGKYALIDKYGNYKSDFIYDSVIKRFNPSYDPFPQAYAIVMQNGEKKYIDWNLEEINLDDYHGEPFVTNFTRMQAPYENIVCLESGEKRALYNMLANMYIYPFESNVNYTSVNEKYVVICKNDKFGLMDYSGNIILPFVYEGLGFAENGLMTYSLKESENTVSGYVDPERRKILSKVLGIPVENGIFLDLYTDYSSGYKRYCAEIINYAGRNLTGEIYGVVQYENGVFRVAEAPTDNPQKIVEVPRDFAVIMLNNEYLPFDGVVRESRTLVPMREIVEGFGGTVEWSEENQAVTANIDGKVIFIKINSHEMIVDGKTTILDVPAQLINNKTMLPVRALAEELGALVDWDERTRCVYIER